jgi:hypothetical protein
VPDTQNMVWAVRVADREFQVRDLPVGVLADIAKKTETSWLLVQAAPLMDANCGLMVLEAVCVALGVDMPQGLTGRTILDFFEQVDDDLPVEFNDGIPPEWVDHSTR